MAASSVTRKNDQDSAAGMILLAENNRMLQEIVAAQINWEAGEEEEAAGRGAISVSLCDFDDVSYRVDIKPEDTDTLVVEMTLPCWGAIKSKGGDKTLKQIYGKCVGEPEEGSVAIHVPLSSLDTEEKKVKMIDDLSRLKVNCVGGFFHHYFEMLNEGKTADPFKLQLRHDTDVYVFPQKDRCVMVYGINFQDKSDQAIARVFMREFVDAKKVIGRAPPCIFNVNPPRELEHFKITEPTGNLGFISFAVLKDHIVDQKRRNIVAILMQSFRTYLQYHLKCSKSFFHSRMRRRVRELLKILSRAKQSAEEAADSKRTVVKRTVGGKIFKNP